MNKVQAFFKSYADSEEQLDYRMAHETLGEKTPAISTGSYILDEALSAGGLPKGRLIQYYGVSGSGKTLMSIIAISEAQKEDPTALQVFIDAEGTFDPSWAEILGADTSKIILIDGDMAVNGRKCFEMILGVPKEDGKTHILKGKSKLGLIDNIINKEININLIILDSLGAIIPPGEDTSAVGKANISLLSRFLTNTFRKLTLDLKKAKVPFIIINHKKDNMDPYGADHTFSGGNTYSHFLSANVYFEAVQRKDSVILDEKENKIGHPIRATIEKSKFGPWPRKCEFKVNFGIGVVDKHEEVAELALTYNVVKKTSTVAHEYKENKWIGFNKYCEALKENKVLTDQILAEILVARELKLENKRKEQQNKLSILPVLSVDNLEQENIENSEQSETIEVTEDVVKRGRKPNVK